MQQIVSEFANIYSVRCTHSSPAGPTSAPSSSQKDTTLKFSRMYRSVIQATLLDEDEDGNKKEERCDAKTRAYLSSVDLAWGLAEAVFFTRESTTLVVPLLVDWVQQHSSLDPDSFKQALDQDPSESREFWNILFKVLLQGFLAEAISLLSVLAQHYYQQHGGIHVDASHMTTTSSRLDHASSHAGNTQAQLVQDIITLLKQSPLVRAAQYCSTYEFRNYCTMWRNSFKELKELAEACGDTMLTKLCALCCGDKSVLNSFLKEKQIGTWYEGLVAYCLYVVPEITRCQLRELVQAMIPSSSLSDSIDKLLFAFLSGDNLEISFLICSVFPDYCTALHLVDLFFFSGLKLSDTSSKTTGHQKAEQRSDILQCLLMDYATKLISHHTLWPYAFMYLRQLETSQQEKEKIMEELIDKIEVQSDQKAVDLIEVCSNEGFVSKVGAINYQRACYHLRNNNLPEASVWALRAKAGDLATQIGLKSVLEFWKEHNFQNLSNVFSKLMMFADENSDKTSHRPSKNDDTFLTMLTNYFMFTNYHRHNEMKNAFQVLTKLLQGPVCWDEMKKHLLFDCVPFIEAGFLRDLDDEHSVNRFLNYWLPPRSHHNDVICSCPEDREKIKYITRLVRHSNNRTSEVI